MKKLKIKSKKICKSKSQFSWILLFIMSMFFAPSGYAQERIDLGWIEAINLALNENPNLASAEAGLMASESNIAIARANYLPGIRFSASVSESKAATFSESSGVIPKSSAVLGATLSQMVYNEKYFANHKIQKYLFASDEEQFRNTKYTTITSAGLAYIGLLFANDLLDVQSQNLAITEKNLQAAKDRQEVGSTNMQEVLRWATQMYSDQQSVQSQKASVISSRSNLNQILNLPLETTEDLENLTIKKDGFIFSSEIISSFLNDENKARVIRDYLVEMGLGNSPIIASYEQQILAQERQLKSNKRWAIPSFSLAAGADAKFAREPDPTLPANDNDQDFWKVGLSMAWPLVDGGANVNKVKQSRSQMSAIELAKSNVETSIEQSIRANVALIISDFVNFELATTQADFAEQNYVLVYDSYLVGDSSLLDLLDAQEQNLEAMISMRIARYTFFADLLGVEQAIGYFPFLEPQEKLDTIIASLENLLIQN